MMNKVACEKEKLLATYERNSTLWKNANAFYVSQDWVKAECFFIDYSERRNEAIELGIHWYDDDGNDVTSEFLENNMFDRFTVRLTNKRGTCKKDFDFKNRDEANAWFMDEVLNNKWLHGWRRVS